MLSFSLLYIIYNYYTFGSSGGSFAILFLISSRAIVPGSVKPSSSHAISKTAIFFSLSSSSSDINTLGFGLSFTSL